MKWEDRKEINKKYLEKFRESTKAIWTVMVNSFFYIILLKTLTF